MEANSVLVIGGGGREHALVSALLRSARVQQVYVAPGNGGTADPADPRIINVDIAADNIPDLMAFAKEVKPMMTIVGPEAPLTQGCVDTWQADGLPCFGPSKHAARLEGSKAFAKAFMERWSIPTARCATFTDFDEANAYLDSVEWPVVIKASGLAAGKGVILPESDAEARQALKEMMVDSRFGQAGAEVLIEERIYGEEVSLLAFCDGTNINVMPPARDHKRLLDGDAGPNTGGMGAYAPTPALSDALKTEVAQTVLQRTVDGMAAEGQPYVGILYAGLMLTEQGPRVLEFNCRFGDPEAQVLLPMLETPLIDVAEACLEGRLASLDVAWHDGAAATVVLASGGYPGAYTKGVTIEGLEAANALEGVQVFHAGTRLNGEHVVTAGGRVLTVTGRGSDLASALEKAYCGVAKINFDGAQSRSDVGRHLR